MKFSLGQRIAIRVGSFALGRGVDSYDLRRMYYRCFGGRHTDTTIELMLDAAWDRRPRRIRAG